MSAAARRRRRLHVWRLGLLCALLGVGIASGQEARPAPTLAPPAAPAPTPVPPTAPSPDDVGLAKSLRLNVVRIDGPVREGGSESGFGFVVGEHRGKLYIATAKHVVGASQPDGESAAVKVTFYDDQLTKLDAKVHSRSETHDLAVLTVPKPDDFPYVIACLSAAGMPAQGTRVWAIGKLQEWRLLPGRLASDRPSSGQEIRIDELQVTPGSSGGLLVAANGIVGMVLADSADDTRALTIDFIRDYFQDFNLAWDLQPLDGESADAGGQARSSGTMPTAPSDPSLEPVTGAYYYLRLKEKSQYLDAAYCSTKLALSPTPSEYAEGACELFRFVPAGGGWSRLQLKAGGNYLSAERCSTEVSLAEISGVADGACQLWRLVPAGEGWSRLQLKHGQEYLDACSPQIGVRPESHFEGGACQLWRLVPQ